MLAIEWIDKTGFKLSEESREKLADREMPLELPHTQAFLAMIALKPINMAYNGLTVVEKYVAFQALSAGARVADSGQDSEVTRIFDTGYDECDFKHLKEKPRLIICDNDRPFAKALRIANQSAVFVSSNMIEGLKKANTENHQDWRVQLKTVLKHELSHVDDFSVHPLGAVRPAMIASGFFTAARHKLEEKAHTVGSENGKDAAALMEALAISYVRNKELGEIMPLVEGIAKSELDHYAKQFDLSDRIKSPLIKVINNKLEKIEKPSLGQLQGENIKSHPSIRQQFSHLEKLRRQELQNGVLQK